VKWIDQVLKVALERVPDPLTEETVAAVASTDAKPVEAAIKH
jgi:ATP-dependent Lon protease